MDDEKTVISSYALKLRTGRAVRHRAGSVTEVVPLTPSGVTREARLAFAARLGLPLIFVSAALYAAGLPWWLPFAASVATVATVWRHQARAAQVASFELPTSDGGGKGRGGKSRGSESRGNKSRGGKGRGGKSRGNKSRGSESRGSKSRGGEGAHGEGGRVLLAEQERAVFRRAVGVSRRIRRTWPGLPGMIDPGTADVALTLALDDLSAVLVRRQELRRLRAGLEEVGDRGVPADSPAVLALAAQRERADELWRETGEQANRILRSLDRAALAGEAFLREREIGETARRAELVLAGLADRPGALAADAGPELAERTAAVITAYRELAAAGQR
ncbi:MAG: hypothetical protein SYR96_31005 [Actinomycetota bacterium]|nr:hypothetical protein [Actinomycetota bacterium]